MRILTIKTLKLAGAEDAIHGTVVEVGLADGKFFVTIEQFSDGSDVLVEIDRPLAEELGRRLFKPVTLERASWRLRGEGA